MTPRETLEKAVRLARGQRTPDPLWTYLADGWAFYLSLDVRKEPTEDDPMILAAAAMIQRYDADLHARTVAYTRERLKHLNLHCPGCNLGKPCPGLPPLTVEP